VLSVVSQNAPLLSFGSDAGRIKGISVNTGDHSDFLTREPPVVMPDGKHRRRSDERVADPTQGQSTTMAAGARPG
jgi:hypothetical protein